MIVDDPELQKASRMYKALSLYSNNSNDIYQR